MATVATLIKAEATHTRVVTLVKGDVYKRVAKAPYGDDRVIYFGVVSDVMANGTEAVVTAIEYQMSYSEVEAKFVTLTEAQDIAIFPATPEEVLAYFRELEEAGERRVASKSRELADAERKLEAVRKVIASPLSAPQTIAVGG